MKPETMQMLDKLSHDTTFKTRGVVTGIFDADEVIEDLVEFYYDELKRVNSDADARVAKADEHAQEKLEADSARLTREFDNRFATLGRQQERLNRIARELDSVEGYKADVDAAQRVLDAELAQLQAESKADGLANTIIGLQAELATLRQRIADSKVIKPGWTEPRPAESGTIGGEWGGEAAKPSKPRKPRAPRAKKTA